MKSDLKGRKWNYKLPIGPVLFPEIFLDEESLQEELPFRKLKALKKKPRLLQNYFSSGGFQETLLSDCLVRQNKSSLKKWLLNYASNQRLGLLLEKSVASVAASRLRLVVHSSFVLVQAQRFNSNIRKVCFFLSRNFRCPTGANVYFTPKSSQTFPRHSDPHDVFILQLQGEKKWKVYPKQGRQRSEKPLIQATLKPGDLLMIPKGFEHEGSTKDHSSLHVTFGLYEATRKELSQFKKKHPYNVAAGPRDKNVWHFLFYLKTFYICQSDPVVFFFQAKAKEKVLALAHRQVFALPKSLWTIGRRQMERNFQHNRFLLKTLN
jgi:hypothetical protein